MEIWKVIPDFNQYEASSEGQIRRIGGGVLRLQFDKRGYASAVLCMNNRPRRKMVNRLVCAAFNGPPPSPLHEAAHLDGRSANNSSENLEWKTRTENEADKLRHGTALRRSRHHMAKLSECQIEEIRSLYSQGASSSGLARQFGVDRTHIWRIARQKNWTNAAERAA